MRKSDGHLKHNFRINYSQLPVTVKKNDNNVDNKHENSKFLNV